MKTRTVIRSALVAMPLAVVLTTVACGSNADGPGPSSTTSPTATREDAPSDADEAAIRLLFDQVNEAWSHGDAAAYASFHTPDADLIDFRGVHVVGRQEIAAFFQPLFDGVLNGTRVEAEIVDLRFLSADMAIFHTEGKIVPTGDNSIQTFVVTRGADGWLVAAFQNTRIQTGSGD